MTSSNTLPTSAIAGSAIVIQLNATPSEQYAAEHLAGLLYSCFGKKPAINNTVKRGALSILIGPSIEGVDFPEHEEDLLIDIRPDHILLTGGGPRGILYAVYEFAQRYLGVRYLTRDHTYTPATLPESIPCERYAHSPDFRFRWSYYFANTDNPEFASRIFNNTVTPDVKLGGNIAQRLIGHSFGEQLPVAKYGKDHPEYFAMVGGKRQADGTRPDAQPCLSNPDVIRIVADSVIKHFDDNPDEMTTSVSANDNDYWCHCDECQAINEREGGPTGSHIAFVNAVAELVEQKHPGKFIGTLAYWHTQCPPKTLKVRHNVQIQLAIIQGCCVHGYHNPPCHENQFMGSLVEEWGKVTDNLYIWDYYTNFGALDLPYPNIRSIGDRVSWYQKWGAKGVFMQANCVSDGGDYSDLRNYVISRCLWDPGLDSWSLAEEFCKLHYGNAANDVMENLTMIHDDAEKADCHPGYYSTPRGLGITQDSARKGLEIFARAKANADSPEVLERVLRVSNCANRAAIESCNMVLCNDLYKLDIPTDFNSVVNDYLELGKRLGVVRAAESLPSDEYNEQLLAAVNGFKAVKIENDTWELIALPEKNTEIVRILHKPSGRDLLRKRWIYWGMEHDYMKYSWSVCEEKLVEGFGDKDNRLVTLMDSTNDTYSFLGETPNGIQIRRIIRLDGEIKFITEIKNVSNETKTIKLNVVPEFGTGIDTNDWGGGDSDILGGYVFGSGEWKQFNKGWNKDHGPELSELEQAKGDKLAFYNKESKFGVCMYFDPDWVEKPRFFWYPYVGCVNLELHSKSIEIPAGESVQLSYSFGFLAEAPKLS